MRALGGTLGNVLLQNASFADVRLAQSPSAWIAGEDDHPAVGRNGVLHDQALGDVQAAT